MTDLKEASVFVTGGAGSLGRAIARKRQEQGWKGKLTVYSRDTFKHERMRKMFPDVNFIQGDILNPELLYNAIIGHDVVIHAAACKVIPTSEYQSIDTFEINVSGSLNVCVQSMRAGVSHVLGISTDKACHPANAYGASKYAMEKVFQEYSRIPSDTEFHLVRYGNVLESTGSVIEAWKNSISNMQPIKMTDPEMTRFWLSPAQAASYAIRALEIPSGTIFIPKMPALSIGKLAAYTIGSGPDFGVERIPLRPGEKKHETLITLEETKLAKEFSSITGNDYYILCPTTAGLDKKDAIPWLAPYSSDMAPELTRNELTTLLND